MSLKLLIRLNYLFLASVLSLAVVGCSLPVNDNRIVSQALPINPNSSLARRFLPSVRENSGLTGAYLLYDGQDAFAARLTLSEESQSSIDAQYYIFEDDISGRILLNSMYKAAERGVRVRLLLDDNATKGKDELFSKFNQHPNIEVRLFNPFMQRRLRPLSYLTDTVRVNRRMHNKSFTIDGVVSIIGGRNVADEYFEVNNGLLFADLDVSVIGEVVQDIEQDFDKYWASELSYPIESIVKTSNADVSNSKDTNTDQTHHKASQTLNPNTPIEWQEPTRTKEYLFSLFTAQYPEYIADNGFEPVWGNATFISDPPSKVSQGRQFAYEDSAFAKVAPLVSESQSRLFIVSPYFVPTQEGTTFLTNLAKQGIEVIILTNSLASTDVTLVHSGYIKYRQELIDGGVAIYEYKDAPKVKEKEKDNGFNLSGILPQNNASLHAKTFTIDGKYLFIGSPNLDPRSAMLNTELGIVFENSDLAQAIDSTFEYNKDEYGYQVENRNSEKGLQWTTIEEGKTIVLYDEPNVHFGEKTIAKILANLPFLDGFL